MPTLYYRIVRRIILRGEGQKKWSKSLSQLPVWKSQLQIADLTKLFTLDDDRPNVSNPLFLLC